MASLESILLDARSLSASERTKLIEKLLGQAAGDIEADEVAIGQRGLAAWTQSTQGEDWEAYYPPALRNNGEHPS